ncbi:MAG: hypothetical protein AB1813_06050 [Verrucomicrobiota bacterium]
MMRPTISGVNDLIYHQMARLGAVVAFAFFFSPAGAALPEFDFTQPSGTQGWQAANHISSLQPTAEGLVVNISGGDPYLIGPARDYPAGTPLWLKLRLKSDQAGSCQIFYFQTGATEANSVRFSVPAGEWFESRVRLPALGPAYRIRIDPPGTSGRCVLASLRFEERIAFQAPAWPKPIAPQITANALSLTTGDLKLLHNRDRLGSFALEISRERMASGNTSGLIGYVIGTQPRWLQLANALPVSATLDAGRLRVTAQLLDPDAGRWQIEQWFSTNPHTPGVIDVESRVTVDRDRAVFYLPMVTLLPGLGNYGTNKTQALFAGLEYLDNEPSSSEADVIGPASKRQVPDQLKITFPLIALASRDRYIGLIWEQSAVFCAAFDSPDRLFQSGGHLMGILYPGSDGNNREESNLLPYSAELIRANQPLILRAQFIGGLGRSIVPAVQQYVALRGLPPLPSSGYTARAYYKLAASGWLDSKIREGNLMRHAVWPGFGAQPAADAALWMDWLAGKVGDADLATRLTNTSPGVLSQVASGAYNAAAVGHIRYPAPALVYGPVAENAVHAENSGRGLLGRFQPDGSVHYQKPSNGTDYGKTHFAPDANGLTAQVVVSLLEAALFSGDKELIDTGLKHLRALEKFRDTVPRGAQTWEVPLHTPDILASANLVRAYTLGYELTGDRTFLEQAKHWAWTGVTFVYLTPPTAQPIGLYSTIPVLGATSWVAPVWIGLPVQWCGLVYAEALHRLHPHDPAGPWKQIADGIAIAGIQHSWPETDSDRKGLLPDIFQLRAQHRDGPAINPATVLAPAAHLFGDAPIYHFRAFLRHGLLVHAPGEIADATERADGLRFTVRGWPAKPYKILVNGVWKKPRVTVNGHVPVPAPPHFEYIEADGRLILQLRTNSVVEIFTPAVASLQIQRSAGSVVKVLWPSNATNFLLQTTSAPGLQESWQTVFNAGQVEGAFRVLTEPADEPTKFFRLGTLQ